MSEQRTIYVHGNGFHLDDALCVVLLRHLPEFKDAKLVRVYREDKILEEVMEKAVQNGDIVCDIGRVYDHSKRLYDHHQQ
ncbi:metal-dependent protein hydrolase, partial [Kipferlia bialata]|eukprot:g13981.t1